MCESLKCCGPYYRRWGPLPALYENRKVDAGNNTLCIECRTVNSCADFNHKHVRLSHTVRVPRKNASEYRWKQFFKIFPNYKVLT